MPISSYSKTAASNTAISGINIAEGCPPSGINDAIRQLMADIATDLTPNQLPTATGTANAIVVALAPAVTAYAAGQRFRFLPSATNTGAATINYGGGAVAIKKVVSNAFVDVTVNDIVSGIAAEIFYDGTRPILLNPANYAHGADIASAATLNLDAATGDYVYVTGTTGITAITLAEGREVTTKFTGILTITNGANLVCPGGSNYTSAANDVIVWRGEASGVVRAVSNLRASGVAVTDGDKGDITVSSSGTVWTIDNLVITYAKLAAAAIGTLADIIAGTASKLIDAATLLTMLRPYFSSQASTSGTAMNFTSIPSGVRRITITFDGVSTNGTDPIVLRVGHSGGVLSSGYLGTSFNDGASSAHASGWIVVFAPTAASLYYGVIEMSLHDAATNTWAVHGLIAQPASGPFVTVCAGTRALPAVLDRIQIAPAAGVNTFDAGQITVECKY